MAAIWDGVGGLGTSSAQRARMGAVEPLLRRLATEQGRAPLDVWRDAVRRFKGDPEATRKRLGLPVLLSQLETWCAPEPTSPKAAALAEADREHQVRALRARLQTAQMGVTHADDDAERARYEREVERLRDAIEKLTTQAA